MTNLALLKADDFWQFSIKLYAYKNNKALLLHLQDEMDANVNLMLFILFLTSLNIACTPTVVKRLKESIDDLDQETKLLRHSRRQLKSELGAKEHIKQELYQTMLTNELNYERKQQVVLVNYFNDNRMSMRTQSDNPGQSRNQAGLSKSLSSSFNRGELNSEYIDQLMANFMSFSALASTSEESLNGG